MCDLKPYQKQALYWMSKIEKGNYDVTEQVLHPFWSAYSICEGRTIYVNSFTGEKITRFPKTTQMAREGIDAMGLGKTVMTVALILSNTVKGTLKIIISKVADDITHVRVTLFVQWHC